MSRTATAAHRTKWALRGLVIPLAAALLVACSSAAPASAPSAIPGDGAPAPIESAPAAPAGDGEAAPGEAAPAATNGDGSQATAAVPAPVGPARKIIKNGTLRLAVADPDVAVDRITQTAADAGGYLLSSKVWVQASDDQPGQDAQPHKYATITLSVPSDQFEPVLSRLRGLAVRVVDETASGEDVTGQFVDLESQLRNQRATRDRIRAFLDKAQTVEEALKVNEQLADIEGQIEQTQGRMNYLAGRSAFSTITVDVEPDLVAVVPTPLPTPDWNPSTTFERAGSTLERALQVVADLAIWFTVVILPFLIVGVAVVWALSRLLRKPK